MTINMKRQLMKERALRDELEQSREVMEIACDFAGMWTFTYDLDRDYVYPNSSLQKEYGFPARVEHFPEAVFEYDYILPEYKELYCDSFRQMKAGESVVEFEIQAKLKDGEVHWLRFRGTRLPEEGNDSRMAVCSALTIDAEKMLELEHQKLSGEEKIYREISDATTTYMFNALGRLDLINDQITLICSSQTPKGDHLQHYNFTELAEDYADRYIVEEDRKMYKATAALSNLRLQLQNADVFEFTHRVIKPDGSIHVMKSSVSMYDREAGICLLSRVDVTSAVAENTEMMNRQERLYTALFSMVPMVISANLTQNNYSMLNYEHFTTKKADEKGVFDELIVVGASTVPEEDREKFVETFSREQLIQAFESGKSKVDLEHRQVGDDGIIRWMLTQVIFVKSGPEDDLYDITLVTDITERKQQQLALREALEEAERAGRAKNDFMSRMSHDLRTPMNVIIGLSALTLDDIDKPDAVRENMSQIRSASDFMLGLVNDILDLARIEEGSVTFNREPYLYSDFLMELKTMFQAQCEEKKIEFLVEDPAMNPVALTDKMRIKQIFFNIISNAIKYTPTGGSISFGPQNIKVNEEKQQITSEFRVSDTGSGMSDEFQKHLFEPFVQEDTSVTPELQGSGLGLSIAKQLIDKMGGTIKIESQKNQGTTVIVTLTFDLVSDKVHQSEGRQEEVFGAMEQLHGKHILLAEDHPLNTQIAKKILEKEEMKVLHAENGKLAVEMFNASPIGSIDAVLMDIRMPEMSGLEAAKAIRALKREDSESVPIIAMSANAYAENVQKSLDAGMNDHLAKPIDPTLLYETLRKYMH